jgi:hypothetical protein
MKNDENGRNVGEIKMDKLDAIFDAIDELNDEERKTLLTGLSDDIAKWLDRLGWMIIGQPQYDDGDYQPSYWFLEEPSDDCPVWCDNGVPIHTRTPPDPRAW